MMAEPRRRNVVASRMAYLVVRRFPLARLIRSGRFFVVFDRVSGFVRGRGLSRRAALRSALRGNR